MNSITKLENYVSIKMQGYSFYSLTYGMDEERKKEILEEYLMRFSSDKEVKVFINTVLYPFDRMLFSRLKDFKGNDFSEIAQEFSLDESLVREKCNEYAYNFSELVAKFGIGFDTNGQKIGKLK